MSGFSFDQAEGLRRLLGRDALRVVAVVSGKAHVGQTSVVANLASALAGQGKSVLVIDEGIGADRCAARFGLAPRIELAQVLKGQAPLAQALLPYNDAIQVLPAREGLRRLPHLTPDAHDQLARELQALPWKPDIALIDMAADRTQQTLPAAAAADAVLVLLGPGHTAITQAYSLIKQLAQAFGQQPFHLLATKTKDDDEAAAIYNNMAAVASHYLQAQLQTLRPIPLDDAIKRADKLNKPAVETFPDAPASLACRALAHAVAAWPALRPDEGHLEGFVHRLIMSGRMSEACVRA